MVLTHFEQSDFGELDSLVYVGRGCQQSSPIVSNSQSVPKDISSSSNSSTLRKTCSETAIDVLSLGNSSHTQTLSPASAYDSGSQSSTLVPQSPFTTLVSPPDSSGIDISVIPATPNPPVEINVIQATPNHSYSPSTDKAEIKGTNGKPSDSASNSVLSRKLQFKFDTSPVSQTRQRQTSTPLRSGSTPSPRISDYDCKEDEDDYPVFDSSGHFMEGTFSLSPISQHYISSSTFNSTATEKSDKG